MWNNWWLREVTGILFKLHPIVLMALGMLDANETFLVLAVSYLASGIAALGKSTFILGYDCFRMRLPLLPAHKKAGEVILYLFGWGLMLFVSCFVLLLFFGILYDAVERQDYPASVFDGKQGAVLVRTLLINGGYFLIVEIARLVRFIRNYTPGRHNVWSAWLFGLNLQWPRKWIGRTIAWVMVSFTFFLFMCTAFAFKTAIFSFFVFDIGLALIGRLADRSSNTEPAANAPGS